MATQLSPEEVHMLQAQGYTLEEINEATANLDNSQMNIQQHQNYQNTNSFPSTFQYNPADNLVKWQLELNDILERTEHALRQDIVVVDRGNIIWKKNPDQDQIVFSEYGVQEIMRILSLYISRNTILSDYEPQEINDIVYDFGKEINDLFFMKYEDIFNIPTFEDCKKILLKRQKEKRDQVIEIYRDFFNTELKEEVINDLAKVEKGYLEVMGRIRQLRKELMKERLKNYPMLHKTIKDAVHSAYKRALYGQERDSLRTARQIAQHEQIVPQGININTGEMKRERGLLNPFRYVGGKYK